jgi:DNA-binding protein
MAKKSKTIKNNFLDDFKIKNIKILELIFGGGE